MHQFKSQPITSALDLSREVCLSCDVTSHCVRRYKKKNQGETEWEIVSRNPEYHVTVRKLPLPFQMDVKKKDLKL